jgi:hypothetical protein
MRRLLAIALLLAVASCGGGASVSADPAYAEKMMVRLGADAPVPAEPGYTLYGTTTVTNDVQQSVALQASAPGDVMLMLGWVTREQGFDAVPRYLEAARQHQNIRWAYLYDELFWENMVVSIGAHEADVIDAAAQAHAAGFKAAITIPPVVLMDPAFRLAQPNAFDVIGIDVYPAGRMAPLAAGCATSSNPFTDLLACSVKRLRAAGYTGQIWFVFQAFNDTETPSLAAALAQQRETIAAAPALGVDGLVSFGYYDEHASMLTPPLIQGHGSPIQSLVECSTC